MKRIKAKLSPDGRLRAGAQIVAAAQTTDTTSVHERMLTFARMHRAYALDYDALAAGGCRQISSPHEAGTGGG